MLKELYNDFHEAGYKLGDKMGQWSQRLVGKLPFADKLTDKQKAYPGALTAAYVGAVFMGSFAIATVMTPVFSVALMIAGKSALTIGSFLTTVGMTTICAATAALSKGLFDGGEKHVGFIAEAKSLWKDIRTVFTGQKNETAPSAPQAAPGIEPAQNIAAAPAGDAFKNAAPRGETPANDSAHLAQNAVRANTLKPRKG